VSRTVGRSAGFDYCQNMVPWGSAFAPPRIGNSKKRAESAKRPIVVQLLNVVSETVGRSAGFDYYQNMIPWGSAFAPPQALYPRSLRELFLRRDRVPHFVSLVSSITPDASRTRMSFPNSNGIAHVALFAPSYRRSPANPG